MLITEGRESQNVVNKVFDWWSVVLRRWLAGHWQHLWNFELLCIWLSFVFGFDAFSHVGPLSCYCDTQSETHPNRPECLVLGRQLFVYRPECLVLGRQLIVCRPECLVVTRRRAQRGCYKKNALEETVLFARRNCIYG